MKTLALIASVLLLLPFGAQAQSYNTGSPNPVPVSTPVVCPNPLTGAVASCATGGGSGGATTVVVPTGLSANGITPIASASAESCHNFKSGGGNVYTIGGVIGGAGWVFILNLSASPSNGAVVPLAWGYYAAQSPWSYTPPAGAPAVFTTGITACYSSTGPFTLTQLTSTALSNSVFTGEVQ